MPDRVIPGFSVWTKKHNTKYEVKIKVSDDWHPNLPGSLVNITVLHLLPRTDNDRVHVRIQARGGDDFGMEFDILVKDEADRQSTFRSLTALADDLKSKEPITSNLLQGMGWIQI